MPKECWWLLPRLTLDNYRAPTPATVCLTVMAPLRVSQGCLRIDHAVAEAQLKADLRCHRCGAGERTIPALKTHLAACRSPCPAEMALGRDVRQLGNGRR